MAFPDLADLAGRAGDAERSVTHLFGGRLLGMPGTHLARVAYPPPHWHRGPWHYWWQAHYLDAVVDAGLRAVRTGDAHAARRRASRGDRLLATVRLRNLGRYANPYYDDMAWLVLACGRLAALHTALGRTTLRSLRAVERALEGLLRAAVTDDLEGGAFWNRHRDVKNVAATGPLALHLARTGETEAAYALLQWMYDRLRDDASGLFLDGIRVTGDGGQIVRDVYSYNQGTVLGALVTLGDDRSLRRAAALVHAVDAQLTTASGDRRVLTTHGDGDGGLFTGILVRYLALAAGAPRLEPSAVVTARRLVLDTADGFWAGRARVGVSGVVFPVSPSARADPVTPPGPVELSTQLQAWMTLEAAAAAAVAPTRSRGRISVDGGVAER